MGDGSLERPHFTLSNCPQTFHNIVCALLAYVYIYPPSAPATSKKKHPNKKNLCQVTPIGSLPSTIQLRLWFTMSKTSVSQSGNSSVAPPVSPPLDLMPDEWDDSSLICPRRNARCVQLRECHCPRKVHKCWRFCQTVVVDVSSDKDCRWRHLFACVECKALQSLDFMC